MTPVVLNVGFYNFVVSDKILSLIRADSAPMRRLIQEARKRLARKRLKKRNGGNGAASPTSTTPISPA